MWWELRCDRRPGNINKLAFLMDNIYTQSYSSFAFCCGSRCSCWRTRWQQRLQLAWRPRPASTSCCCRTGTCCSTWRCSCSSWKRWRAALWWERKKSSHNRTLRRTDTVSDPTDDWKGHRESFVQTMSGQLLQVLLSSSLAPVFTCGGSRL